MRGTTISRTAYARGTFRQRSRGELPRVDLHAADSGRLLLSALQSFGAAIVVSRGDESVELMTRCYNAASEFFSLPLEAKARHGAGDGAGQAHGYMTYLQDEEGSECFEAKVHHDQCYVWPTTPVSLRATFEHALDYLRCTALHALRAILAALGGSVSSSQVLALLDVDGESPQLTSIDLDTCSHTAMRVWSYTEGRVAGWHCDNTLLTLGPIGSSPGLQIRTLNGHECFPECSMAPGEVILFAGDALSYLTAGALPALMHRVVPDGTGIPRLSAPFFLRGKRGDQLRPPPPLPPLSIEMLERNPGNLRSSWPWKQGKHAYYQDTVWHATQ